MNVAVLFGGKSVEHEVSIISGLQAIQNMDREKYTVHAVYMDKEGQMYTGDALKDIAAYRDIKELLKKARRVILIRDGGRAKLIPYPHKLFGNPAPIEVDVVFPVVHGTNVEDGTLQGYLGTVGVPYVGCGVAASALGMDKYMMKAALKESDIPVLPARLYGLKDYEDMDGLLNDIEEAFEYPVIIKPVNLGSSVGIGMARNRSELTGAVDDAFQYATRVLAEHAISRLREINCAVLGDENEAIASECEEPLHSKDILSYKDKYESGGKGGGKGMASVSRRIPADIPAERKSEVQRLAVRAFKALGCCGVARIDFMIDEETGKLYFNEINTIPGSLSFYLWEPVGISFKELNDRLIKLALKRDRMEKNLTFAFDTNILSSAALNGTKGKAPRG